MSLSSTEKPKSGSDYSAAKASGRVFPSAIVRQIFQFVPLNKVWYTVPVLHDDVVPEAPTPVLIDLCRRVGHVSSEYASIVREIAVHHDETVRKCGLHSYDPEDVEAFYNQVAWNGEKLQCLVIEFGSVDYRRRGFSLYQELGGLETLDALIIDWTRVFASCPNLRRLDLELTPMRSTQLIRILDAVSRQCTRLEALVLPNEDSHSGAELLPLMTALHAALRQWFEHGTSSSNGLRQLCVPKRVQGDVPNGPSFVELTDEFLRHVTRYCPHIEYLDGYRHSFDYDEMLWCEEFICCSLEVWEEFCKACSNLRELNWFAFPYLDPFFEIFGRYPKPQLTKLILAGGEHHNYRTNEAGYYNNAYSYTAAGLVSLFPGCPALKKLEILFMDEIDDDARQLSMTDDVLVAIATHCTALERFEIRELQRSRDIRPMKNVTDKGLTALAKLPKLWRVRIKSTQCTEAGIFALMTHAPSQGMTREATIRIDKIRIHEVGDSRYKTFIGLLKLMIASPQETVGRLFDVTVYNHTCYRELTEGPEAFTSECLGLLKKLTSECPHVAVVVTNDNEIVDTTAFEGQLSKLRSLRFVSPPSAGRLRKKRDAPEW